MMHHATKRGFKDCPGFLNSTGRLGAKRGRKCYVTLAFSGVPNKGGQNQKSKPTLRVTMMPLGAPSITKYGSLVRPDAQIVALRAHCARTALKAPPQSHVVKAQRCAQQQCNQHRDCNACTTQVCFKTT